MDRLLEILKSRKFQTRLISGIALVLLAVLVIMRGGALLFFVMMAVSMVGLFELYRVVNMEKEPIGLIGYAGGAAYYALLWFRDVTYGLPVLIGVMMGLMAVFVFTYPRYRTEQVTVGLFGILYTVVMFSYVYKVRVMHDGKYLVWLIFLSSWGCDTCAYVVGMLFGKHHFAPVLSPKKTLEGCIGGAIGAGILGAVYGALVGEAVEEVVNPCLAFFIACLISAVISQVGDLAASAIKRDHGVKDYGDIIPGHGGVLDRFDSMLFTAPAICFALFLYGQLV